MQHIILTGLTKTHRPTDRQRDRQLTAINRHTLCSEKNTHSRFLSYLHGKHSDFHKIFRECL